MSNKKETIENTMKSLQLFRKHTFVWAEKNDVDFTTLHAIMSKMVLDIESQDSELREKREKATVAYDNHMENGCCFDNKDDCEEELSKVVDDINTITSHINKLFKKTKD